MILSYCLNPITSSSACGFAYPTTSHNAWHLLKDSHARLHTTMAPTLQPEMGEWPDLKCILKHQKRELSLQRITV